MNTYVFYAVGAFLALSAATAAAWRLFVDIMHRRVIDGLAAAPGMSALDIGCGTGRLSLRLARAVHASGKVVAVDVDRRALRAAAARAGRAGVSNIRFVQAAAERLIIGAGSFDRAVLVAVLGEIPDRPAAMARVAAALKPDGLLSVTEVALDPHRQRADDVRRLAADAGLQEAAHSAGCLFLTIVFRRP